MLKFFIKKAFHTTTPSEYYTTALERVVDNFNASVLDHIKTLRK